MGAFLNDREKSYYQGILTQIRHFSNWAILVQCSSEKRKVQCLKNNHLNQRHPVYFSISYHFCKKKEWNDYLMHQSYYQSNPLLLLDTNNN